MGRARRPPGSLLAAVAADELGDPGRADAAPVVVHCQAPVCRLAWLPRARVMTSWSGACTVAGRVAAVTIGLPAGLPARASRGSATAATTPRPDRGARQDDQRGHDHHGTGGQDHAAGGASVARMRRPAL